MRIIIDNKIPFIKGVLDSIAEVEYLPGGAIDKETAKNADALITRTRTKCNKALLEGSKIKFIASATIGYDHIDTGYCEQNSIFWTNAPGCNSSSVAQYITSVLLNLAVRHRVSLKGKTLGVVGCGNVGKKVVKVGQALGMKVLVNDPPRERAEGNGGFSSLSRLQDEADFITMHVPLNMDGTDKTFHLADTTFFECLGRKPFFFNSSRGEVAETSAVISAIEKGMIAGAVLDVWENEPDIDKKLLSLADIATPHIAGYSADGKANGTSMSVRALSDFFGLDFGNWYPEKIPLPENTSVILEPTGKTFEELMLEAVSFSYNAMDDDRRLRQSPETFEKQRGDYPLRREFPVFSVIVSQKLPENVMAALQELGFILK